MEAEAQCAKLEQLGLVDGVVSDDSDCLLFGARNVFKDIFDERKFVKVFRASDIQKDLGFTRDDDDLPGNAPWERLHDRHRWRGHCQCLRDRCGIPRL